MDSGFPHSFGKIYRTALSLGAPLFTGEEGQKENLLGNTPLIEYSSPLIYLATFSVFSLEDQGQP